MNKKRQEKIFLILLVLLLIISLFTFYILFNNEPKKPTISEQDFKILSVNWQTYQYDYDRSTYDYYINEEKPLDWDLICEKNIDNQACNWEIITHMKEDTGCHIIDRSKNFDRKRLEVECEVIIDGVKKRPINNLDGSTRVLKFEDIEGLDRVHCLENLDTTKDHIISFCCSNRCMEGQVCQTFNLPAKC